MELDKINSSNMTDKIIESMPGTEDEPLYMNESVFRVEKEDNNDAREENGEVYEEYGNEEVYEEYKFEGDYEEYSSGFEIAENRAVFMW